MPSGSLSAVTSSAPSAKIGIGEIVVRQRDAAVRADASGLDRRGGGREHGGAMLLKDADIFAVLARLAEMPEVVHHIARDQHRIFTAAPFDRNHEFAPAAQLAGDAENDGNTAP